MRLLPSVPVVLAILGQNAKGIHLSTKKFQQNGGNPADPGNTFWTAYKPLFDRSFAPPMNSLVKLISMSELCSGSFLGTSNEGGKTFIWVLTAAHCLAQYGHSGSGVPTGPWQGALYDFNLGIVGMSGSYFLPQERIGTTSGLPSYGTDIAILKILKSAEFAGRNGQQLAPVTIYCGQAELGQAVTMAGHGSWGVAQDNHGEWQPPKDGTNSYRRAFGPGKITVRMSDGADQIPWDPQDGIATNTWARVAEGDSGGPTYATIGGKAVQVGVNGAYSSEHSIIARVGHYCPFIRSTFPGVQVAQ